MRATKEALGWDPGRAVLRPDEVYAHLREPAVERGAASSRPSGRSASTPGRPRNPELAAEWERRLGRQAARRRSPTALPVFEPGRAGDLDAQAGERGDAGVRRRSCRRWSAAPPTSSTRPSPSSRAMQDVHAGARRPQRPWGVREHGMGAAVNGLALHGGIVKPFGSTFFVFTDYMRPPIRLSALMKLDVVWIFSHDSVAVGEDGPTHQPIEHLAAMRAIPNLTVIRPADANEAAEAWRAILEDLARPGLPRALAPERARSLDRSVLGAGARVCAAAPTCSPTPTRPTSCSSRPAPRSGTALEARELLAEQGIAGARRLDAVLGALRGAERRLPRRGPAGRRAEDLGRGRRRRSAGRAGSTPRSGSTTSAPPARAPRCSSTSGSAGEAVAARVRDQGRRARRRL